MKLQEFEEKVEETVNDYDLIEKGERVFVACSGGKDSSTALYILDKLGYDVEAMIIDLKIGTWSERNLENLKELCEQENINLNVVDIREELGHSICHIRSMVQSKKDLKDCTICGVLRRWLINKKARELGADKLATGHNLDDEAQTIFMNLLKGNPGANSSTGPNVGVNNESKFINRIKPLFFCPEEKIKEYSKKKEFPVIYKPCPCSTGSFRKKIKMWLRKRKPEYRQNLVEETLSIAPELAKNRERNLNYCNNCGEPASGETCRACRLLDIIKEN